MGDTWWVIIICPCVNVFSLMGGVTEADVGFPTVIIYYHKRVEAIRSMSSTAIRELTGNWIIRGTYLNVSGI
jgi:hypothetical protein